MSIKTLHFLHIGKTGGTAFKHAVSSYQVEKFNVKLHPHGVTLKDIPEGEKVIFFLRDPVRRFESGFYSRKRRGQPRYFSEWSEAEKIAFEHFNDSLDLVHAANDESNAKHSLALAALDSIEHVRNHFTDWLISTDYIKERESDIFYVGFQETLENDFSIIKGMLGLPDELSLPRDDVNAHKNPVNDKPELDQESINFLKGIYSVDYDIYEFCARRFSNNMTLS
ncbi:MAG: sulfotransferase family 2 domain-containing protein [Arenicella sp.]